jgi:hypothetical protein
VQPGRISEESTPVTGLRLDKNSTSGDWSDSGGTGSSGDRSSGTETGSAAETTTTEANSEGRQIVDTITIRIKRFVTVILTGLGGGDGSEDDYYEAIVAWMVLTFGVMTLVLVGVGIVVNPVILGLAAVFALTTGLMYYHLSGQMAASVYRHVEQQAATNGQTGAGGSHTTPKSEDEISITEKEAYEVLGVPLGSDDEAVTEAYRDRIKEAHPDTDGGSEEEFKRVKDAYEILQE